LAFGPGGCRLEGAGAGLRRSRRIISAMALLAPLPVRFMMVLRLITGVYVRLGHLQGRGQQWGNPLDRAARPAQLARPVSRWNNRASIGKMRMGSTGSQWN